MSDSAFRPAPDDDWEALMDQLRQQPQGQPRPYFYNRVSARLASRPTTPSRAFATRMLRPAYAALLGVAMLALSGDVGAGPPASDAAPANTTTTARPLAVPPR